MSTDFVNPCHLKRESTDLRRSNAYDSTLCGREDSGQYMYATLEPGDPVPDLESYPVCPKCVTAHLSSPAAPPA